MTASVRIVAECPIVCLVVVSIGGVFGKGGGEEEEEEEEADCFESQMDQQTPLGPDPRTCSLLMEYRHLQVGRLLSSLGGVGDVWVGQCPKGPLCLSGCPGPPHLALCAHTTASR